MAEYICKEDFIKILKEKSPIPFVETNVLIGAVSVFPSADVKPVVRCNECNLYDGVHEVHGIAPCIYWMHMTMWDDYCSHGVRMDGET